MHLINDHTVLSTSTRTCMAVLNLVIQSVRAGYQPVPGTGQDRVPATYCGPYDPKFRQAPVPSLARFEKVYLAIPVF